MNVQPWRQGVALYNPKIRTIVYCLSLTLYGVYWNFYALSSVASRHGWNFVEGLIAPCLAVTLFLPLLQRMTQIAKRENIESLSDFIATRYGKNKRLGVLVSVVACLGINFFIAQQLRSLYLGWSDVIGVWPANMTLAISIAGVLAALAIFFGARRPTFTSRNPALMNLVAFDGALKLLIIFCAAAACTVYLLSHHTVVPTIPRLLPIQPDIGFFGMIFLLTGMIFCMPQLFHVAVVESERDADLRVARMFLPLYFALCFFGLTAILWVGSVLPPQAGSDTYIFDIVRAIFGASAAMALLLVSFFTAGTFVAAASSSLAAMLSAQISQSGLMDTYRTSPSAINVGRRIMQSRRATIILILLSGCVSARWLDGQSNTTIGLLSLSVLIQLLPAIFAAVTWRRAHVSGVIAGIGAGVLIWALFIAWPFLRGERMESWFFFHLAAAPTTDFFFQRLIVSLAANVLLLVTISQSATPRLIDRIQAAAFIDLDFAVSPPTARPLIEPKTTNIANLKVLLAQFLGEQDAATALYEIETKSGRKFKDTDTVDNDTIRDVEEIFAGILGTSLANSIVHWQLTSPETQSAEMIQLLEQTAQAIRLNREVLQATLNNLSQGVCVVDKQFQLVAWNARYLEIFDLGPGVIKLGTSLADIIRLNRSRSGYSADDTERYIRRRLRDVRLGIPHVFERTWSTGKTLRVIGLPMSDGRYVTSFTDVTSVQDVVTDLRHANQMLEERVRLRTAELTHVNEALKVSTLQAERARASQARFLAAASHDLLQPLHAARLFLGALQEQTKENEIGSDLLHSADVSIETANRLLNALLNLSRLEVGGLRPEVRPVDVNLLLRDLEREFTPVARSKGLTLRILPTKYWALSDEDLLRSILQNLIGNAVRYTETGSVLVLCRIRSGEVLFEVRDSGPGIPEQSIDTVFEEYVRLPQTKGTGRGMGLGLSIVKRICLVLGHRVSLRTAVGRGTTFSVAVAMSRGARKPVPPSRSVGSLAGLTLLCVEDDGTIRRSLETLLRRWHVTAEFVSSVEEALERQGRWDVVLTDFHFDSEMNGLDLVDAMAGRADKFALVTAEDGADIVARANQLGVDMIRKPVAPATLRTFLSRVWLLKSARN